MRRWSCLGGVVIASMLLSCGGRGPDRVVEPPGPGAYAVGVTNLEVAAPFAEADSEEIFPYLLGRASEQGEARYLLDLLRYPESAWVVPVEVPAAPAMYGDVAGTTLPVVSFVAYPRRTDSPSQPYEFPYENGRYGTFEHMLGPGQPARLATSQARYPLILLAHGMPAHGLYDVSRAHRLASHGYIVAVITYGDDRAGGYQHAAYLRPLISKAVLDSLLASEVFGPHIDVENIGMAGHSFGGFTTLAMAGGRYQGNPASVTDARIKAGAVAAPWVGGEVVDGAKLHAFGPQNQALAAVTVPILCQYGTRDEVTRARDILPAMRQLSGPTYVVAMADQPHIFDAASWQDRDNWELLFFAATLQQNAQALEALQTGAAMGGGNIDRQRFDYQQLPDERRR